MLTARCTPLTGFHEVYTVCIAFIPWNLYFLVYTMYTFCQNLLLHARAMRLYEKVYIGVHRPLYVSDSVHVVLVYTLMYTFRRYTPPPLSADLIQP